ncbi:hypothetical protein EON65_52410, partial [archaeon]
MFSRRSMFLMDVWDSSIVSDIFQSRIKETVVVPVVNRILAKSEQPVLEAAEIAEAPPIEETEPASRPRRRIAPAVRIASADELYSQLRDPSKHTDYDMIKPHEYGDPKGVAPNEQQPYQVIVSPLVCTLCELHCYLSENEVIGMLAGHWDTQSNTMCIMQAIPCVANTGKTDVDMDPIAQLSAMSAATGLGLQLVGWYHSHPTFDPYPSLIDVKNHKLFQDTFQKAAQPFVGLIVNNQSNLESRLQWFSVKKYDKSHGNAADVYLPLNVHVEVGNVLVHHAVPLSLDRVGKEGRVRGSGNDKGEGEKSGGNGGETKGGGTAEKNLSAETGDDGMHNSVLDDAKDTTARQPEKSNGRRKGEKLKKTAPASAGNKEDDKDEEVPEVTKPAKRAKKGTTESSPDSQVPTPPTLPT